MIHREPRSSLMDTTVNTKKTDRQQAAPFPFRMTEDVKQAALRAKVSEERSLNWILNDRLKIAFGLKKVA